MLGLYLLFCYNALAAAVNGCNGVVVVVADAVVLSLQKRKLNFISSDYLEESFGSLSAVELSNNHLSEMHSGH